MQTVCIDCIVCSDWSTLHSGDVTFTTSTLLAREPDYEGTKVVPSTRYHHQMEKLKN